jgi:aryl-alcohol dehydrogenase-like predicted oxidoreductase
MKTEADMKHRRLGRNGPEISVVGFGAWAVGGAWQFGWGHQDDAESVAAIRHAIESGVNWVDTAAAYGHGHSEEVVRRALEPYTIGEDVFVFTKCGLNWYDTESGEAENNLRPESIRFECDQSLKRLGVERIDLYQFHWPDDSTGTPIEDSWATMTELVQEGKVRWGGVSNFDVGLLERCEAIRHVDSLQPLLNLIHPDARSDVIPWARQHGTGVIGYSPMASGLLTGAFSEDRVRNLAEDDWRRSDADFRPPQLARNLALVAELRTIAAHMGTSLPALSVAWTLAIDGVTGAIVAARRPKQVDEWLPAADLDLSKPDLESIEVLLDNTDDGAAQG